MIYALTERGKGFKELDGGEIEIIFKYINLILTMMKKIVKNFRLVFLFFLALFLINESISQININYGETLTGTISVDGEVDIYTFSKSANDKILIRLTEHGDYPNFYLEPQIELFAPSGSLIISVWDASQAEITHTLTTGGTYTLFVSDYGANATGHYSIFFQRTFNSGNATTIEYGQTLTGNLFTYGAVDTYQFEGSVNDSVIIQLTEDSGYPNFYLETFVELYGPNGDLLSTAWDDSQATIGHKLLENGYYSILTSDNYPGDDYGDYSIFIFGFDALNTETEILSYSFGMPPQTGEAIIDSINQTVTVEVEYGTDLTDLVTTFILSTGATATVGGVGQESGVTANDFTNSVTYIVTAEDGLTVQDWVVTVDIETGIHENSIRNINIYPNPFTNQTTIKFHNPNHSNYKLSVFSVAGNKVFVRDHITTDQVEFDKGNLISDTYIIELIGERVFRGRMVIK